MPFKKGESGNQAGRPPKSRALSDLLGTALAKTIETDNGKVAGKRILASLVTEAATTGKVTFPGDKAASQLSVKDWLEFVKWIYQYMEPPVQRQELTGKDGGAIEQKVMITDDSILRKLLPELSSGDAASAAATAE